MGRLSSSHGAPAPTGVRDAHQRRHLVSCAMAGTAHLAGLRAGSGLAGARISTAREACEKTLLRVAVLAPFCAVRLTSAPLPVLPHVQLALEILGPAPQQRCCSAQMAAGLRHRSRPQEGVQARASGKASSCLPGSQQCGLPLPVHAACQMPGAALPHFDMVTLPARQQLVGLGQAR